MRFPALLPKDRSHEAHLRLDFYDSTTVITSLSIIKRIR